MRERERERTVAQERMKPIKTSKIVDPTIVFLRDDLSRGKMRKKPCKLVLLYVTKQSEN